MCLACNQSSSTAQCKVQTMRAVSFVTSRGLCSAVPAMDCTGETLSQDGGRALDAVHYWSLGPAFGEDYFAALGNSFGGLGIYRSSPLA